MVVGKCSIYSGLPGTQLKTKGSVTMKECRMVVEGQLVVFAIIHAYNHLFNNVLYFLCNKFWVHWKFFMVTLLHRK